MLRHCIARRPSTRKPLDLWHFRRAETLLQLRNIAVTARA
jgi:hypothetical protein